MLSISSWSRISGLKGGFRYYDAQTDDARLELRVIREAVAESDGRVQALPVDDRDRFHVVRSVSLLIP